MVFIFVVPGTEPRGILPPRYTPGPIFFMLYFETGSHEVAEGLTKERERERQGERERDRERAEAGREPGSSGLCLPNTGITSVRHHARPSFSFF